MQFSPFLTEWRRGTKRFGLLKVVQNGAIGQFAHLLMYFTSLLTFFQKFIIHIYFLRVCLSVFHNLKKCRTIGPISFVHYILSVSRPSSWTVAGPIGSWRVFYSVHPWKVVYFADAPPTYTVTAIIAKYEGQVLQDFPIKFPADLKRFSKVPDNPDHVLSRRKNITNRQYRVKTSAIALGIN